MLFYVRHHGCSMRKRFAIVALTTIVSGCGGATEVVAPEIVRPGPSRVGLSNADQRTFYHLEEGSEVFPVSWFLALEDENGTGRFADNLERFGFIPDPKSDTNPYGLPIGLTAADARDLKFLDVKMLGVSCAACHVGEVTTRNGRRVLDGAPARVNTSVFYLALVEAVKRTLDWHDPKRFLAFVARVAVAPDSPAALRAPAAAISPPAVADAEFTRAVGELLKAEEARPPIDITATVALKHDATRSTASEQLNRDLNTALPTPRAGRGVGAAPQLRSATLKLLPSLRLLWARLAFLMRLAGTPDPGGVLPGFGRLDAFGGARNLLWHDGKPVSAPVSYPDLWSFDRLSWVHWDANTTSVLERNIGQALGLGAVLDKSTLVSTVSVVNLHQLETLAAKIKPPRWTDVFGGIDAAKAARGRTIFDRDCASCHVARLGERISNDELDVDPNRADNFALPISGQPNEVAIADLIGGVKRKAYEEKGFTKQQQDILEGGRIAMWRSSPKQYAVRSLTAIWASAPYLHNNSVPTLRDLLTPPENRPRVFFAGRTDYDLVKLGFLSDDDGKGRFPVDTSLAGNRNTGHRYGTMLAERDKIDLLEYLKVF